jgi:hypothetical protein
MIYLMIVFHLMSCIWILLGKTEKGWIDILTDDDKRNS